MPKDFQSLRCLAESNGYSNRMLQNSKKFPSNEKYGLTSQIQRAAVSISANIAEGQSRQHTKEFLHHLSIAYRLLAELETHVQIAKRLSYITTNELEELLNKTSTIGRILNGLRKSLEKRLISVNGYKNNYD